MTPEMQEIADDFALFDDWEDKYAYLIELGRKLPSLEEAFKTDEYKVRGCVSQVWLVPETKQGEPDRLYFRADSDAHITKGLVALLLKVYSGQTKQAILEADIGPLFEQLGLKNYLSPNRSNGFFSMVKRIRELAG